jgi:hypothetical protein
VFLHTKIIKTGWGRDAMNCISAGEIGETGEIGEIGEIGETGEIGFPLPLVS